MDERTSYRTSADEWEAIKVQPSWLRFGPLLILLGSGTPFLVHGFFESDNPMYLLGGLCGAVVLAMILCYFPHGYNAIGRKGLLNYHAIKIGPFTLWERTRKLWWTQVEKVVSHYSWFGPVNETIIAGRFRTTSGEELQRPIGFRTWEVGHDDAVDRICAQVAPEKIEPEVVRYLKEHDLHDPKRHPEPTECGAALA